MSQCKTCGGHGRIRVLTLDPQHLESEFKTCPICLGSGDVPCEICEKFGPCPDHGPSIVQGVHD